MQSHSETKIPARRDNYAQRIYPTTTQLLLPSADEAVVSLPDETVRLVETMNQQRLMMPDEATGVLLLNDACRVIGFDVVVNEPTEIVACSRRIEAVAIAGQARYVVCAMSDSRVFTMEVDNTVSAPEGGSPWGFCHIWVRMSAPRVFA